MQGAQIHEIVIIGAGRLATHLGVAFYKHGLNVVQVYNRTPERGIRLAEKIGAAFTDKIREIESTADLYILAVSDSTIEELAHKLQLDNKLVVHTSGTVEIDILAPISKNTGVFYPVQTFTNNRRVDFRGIPLCIEANSAASEELLTELAKKLSQHVYSLASDKRRLLHLGAVFASNFTNFMYAVSEELLLSGEIPFNLLEPLIIQTVRNINHGNLIQSQTGPAVRGDMKVLETHRALLSGHPDYLEIYNLITQNIIKHKSLHGKL
ncbi:MAG: DUF2520 domain-containing protein [Bacteroidetes bacterium]|nr:DUF2520 domain-containing protein [Bacteroidota bacterium]